MIHDLDLIKDISPLFSKNIVIWGAGKNGSLVFNLIKEMGAGKQGMFFCDSNSSKIGKKYMKIDILSPETLKNVIGSSTDYIIIISPMSYFVQNEICKKIQELRLDHLKIFSEFGVRLGLQFNLRSTLIDKECKRQIYYKKLYSHNIGRGLIMRLNALQYFSFLGLHNNKPLIIYSAGKVGSSSIAHALYDEGLYIMNCHNLKNVSYDEKDIFNLMSRFSGKIISCVRDPIARCISHMWDDAINAESYIDQKLSIDISFEELHEYYMDREQLEAEFTWFDYQMKPVFDIDIYEYPFDKSKGYTIINKNNISLLIVKMEKLDQLENVIGDFVGIQGLKLEQKNSGKAKAYRYAYKQYKDEFKISQETADYIYFKNKHVQHFYSEEERNVLFNKWNKNII